MSLFREQRRALGRMILGFCRKIKEGFFGKQKLPDPHDFPKRILIIRPFFLGDILLCLPIAQAIKKKYPTAHVSWLLRQEWENLIKNHSVVDAVIPFNASKLHGLNALSEWFRIVRELRRQSFDLVINLSWDRSTMLWSWASGARITIGIEEFGRPRLLSLLYSVTVIAPERAKDARHMADFYFEPLKTLGFGDRSENPLVFPTNEEKEHVEMYISQLLENSSEVGATVPVVRKNDENGRAGMLDPTLFEEQLFILIHPGGRLSNKRWPVLHFAEFITKLAEKISYPIVLVCGPGEQVWTADLAKDLPQGRSLFLPSLTLGEFMALAKRAKLFVGNDSGPMHLAAASGCPVLALFGTDSTRWRPLGRESDVIENREGISKISVDEVLIVALNKLKGTH
jgi:heptosyltransferase-3